MILRVSENDIRKNIRSVWRDKDAGNCKYAGKQKGIYLKKN